MQTDSLLTEADRKMLARWKENRSLEWQQMSASMAARLANEIERLEHEKHRLQTRVDSLDCAHKLALGEVERLTQENQRLRDEKSEASFLAFSNDGGPISDLATTRDALTAARAEVQRLRGEIDAEKIASTYWQDQYNIRNDVAISVGDQLAAVRAEVQRLRENAEMDQAQRAEWQKTIDKLEAENEKLSTNLRLSLILSDPVHAGLVMERIEKLESDASRVALLEGRIQGIAEAAKERLDSHDFRLRALEANGWAGHSLPYTASNIPPFNSGYVDGNPSAEDLLPKGDLR